MKMIWMRRTESNCLVPNTKADFIVGSDGTVEKLGKVERVGSVR